MKIASYAALAAVLAGATILAANATTYIGPQVPEKSPAFVRLAGAGDNNNPGCAAYAQKYCKSTTSNQTDYQTCYKNYMAHSC